MKGLNIFNTNAPNSQDKVILEETSKLYSILDVGLPADIIKEEIEKLKPDYILFPTHTTFLDHPLDYIDVPKILASGDFFRRLQDNTFKDFYKKNKCSGITTDSHCAIEPLKDYFGDLNPDIFYFKWPLNLNIMKDYGLKKDIDVIFSGRFSSHMMRRELDYIFSFNNIGITYRNYKPSETPDYSEYARHLNQSWFGIGGCLQKKEAQYYKDYFIGYTFPKTLEIPACHSCLLNIDWADREYLGFKEDYNCVLIKTPREALRKVKYYIDDKEELMKITERGYRLVQENHDITKILPNLKKDIEDKYK